MTLAQANKGEKFEVLSIPDYNISAQAIRLGVYKGAKLVCADKLPAGPIIIQNRMQEIAVGRGLAKKIMIRTIE